MPEASHLSPTGRRALAAQAITAADPTVAPLVATVLADALDATAAAVLAAGAVLSPPAARTVLAALWAEPTTDVTGAVPDAPTKEFE